MTSDICIREINQNLKNVFEGKALTRPLATLNRDCRFRERYEIDCDLIEEETHKKCPYCKESFLKEEGKIYCSEECKKKIREYNRKYYQRPEVKKKSRECQRRKNNTLKENWRVKE